MLYYFELANIYLGGFLIAHNVCFVYYLNQMTIQGSGNPVTALIQNWLVCVTTE